MGEAMDVQWTGALFLLSGIVLLLATAVDFLSTVLTVTGGGQITGRIHAWTWRGLLVVHRRYPSHAHLARAGPTFAVITMLFWAAALWLGWTLVFYSEPSAVIRTATGEEASFSERAYYVGYTLTTLGLGDFSPQGTPWRIATVLAAANGLFLFTMAITYIVPVIEATASMRSLAAYVRRLGDSPTDIVERTWYQSSFTSVNAHLTAITPQVDAMAQQFLAYPILRYFHSPEGNTSLPIRLASLDEALTILAEGVEVDHRPAPQCINPLRMAIAGYLEIQDNAHIDSADKPPPPAKLSCISEPGIPLCSQASFDRTCDALKLRRRRLLALVIQEGWQWEDVTAGGQ